MGAGVDDPADRRDRRRAGRRRSTSRTATTAHASIGAAEVPELDRRAAGAGGARGARRRLDVSGAAELRVKESDRITALVHGLARAGRRRGRAARRLRRSTGRARPHRRHGRRGRRPSARDGVRARRARRDGPDDRSPAPTPSRVSYPGFARDLADADRVTTDKIYLVGFMASGKSTIARALAARLRWRVEDIDDLIEARERRTIAEIFAQQGEPYFRAVEREILRSSSRCGTLVVATGGGTFADPENRAFINLDGVSVWIDVPLADLIPRIPLDGRRPLAADRAQLERLYAARVDAYRLAHVRVCAAARAGRGRRRSHPRGDSRAAADPRAVRRRIADAVRYLILSDLHANLQALDAVLADARRVGYDEVLVLGDLVGYGADPAAVIDAHAGARAGGDRSAAITTRCARPRARRCSSTTSRARSIEWTRRRARRRRSCRRWRDLPKGPRLRRRRRSRSATARRSTRTTTSSTTATPRARSTPRSRAHLPLRPHAPAGALRDRATIPSATATDPADDELALPPAGPGADQRRVGRPAARRRPARGLRHPRHRARHDLQLRRVAYDIAGAQAQHSRRGSAGRGWRCGSSEDSRRLGVGSSAARSSDIGPRVFGLRLLARSSRRFSSAAYASCAARDPRIQPITTPTSSTPGMKMK